MTRIRTRFAPSPTGMLHVGGLRTALYGYLFAKRHGGDFLLRIEDTDQERFVEGSVEVIVSSLAWAGIIPDEGVCFDASGQLTEKGDKGPYTQSKRLPIYREYAEVLLKSGHAYYCFCTKERLDEVRKMQEAAKQPTGYDGHCRTLALQDIASRLEKGESHVIRLKVRKEGKTSFTDLIRGEVVFENALIDDQVLMKSDGFPTYHLAVVVDDHLMEITHVTRSEEWLPSTPKHIMLYEAFGWEAPQFGHLTLLVNEERKKLSKRHGDVSVEDFRNNGFLPEALVNFIAFLGWNPGTEQELYTLPELVQAFSFEYASKAAALFNREKLAWYNAHYIRQSSVEQLSKLAWPFMVSSGLFSEADLSSPEFLEAFRRALPLAQERAVTLKDIPTLIRPFVVPLPEFDPLLVVWKKSTPEGTKQVLEALVAHLLQTPEELWQTKAAFEPALLAWIVEKGLTNGDVLWPMRVALSGEKNSPGPTDIAVVLGKVETMTRLQQATKRLEG